MAGRPVVTERDWRRKTLLILTVFLGLVATPSVALAGLTRSVLAQLGVLAACLAVSAGIWKSMMDRMPVAVRIGKRRISARLGAKLLRAKTK